MAALTEKYRPYPAYKPSGVEWLGEIPTHWEVAGVKHHYTVQLGKMLQNAPYTPDDVEVPYLRAVHVQWFDVQTTDPPTMWASQKEVETFGIAEGDLLVCEGGEGGRCGIVESNVDGYIIQNALHRVRPREHSLNDFLQYTLSTVTATGWFDAINERATIAHFTGEKFNALKIPMPPLPEQRAIAFFLARETAKIDALVSKKERLIELLREKRTALISHAVTKGLDSTAPMKDSGAEWLGQIPAHWKGLPLKRWVTAKITDGPHETPELLPNGVDFISAEAISDGRIDFEKRRGFVSQVLHGLYSRKCKPVRDDILICKSGATTGKLAIVDTDISFSIWSPLALVRSDHSRIRPRFLKTALEADYVQNQIKRTWSAGTQPNISMGDLERLYVVVPALGEQAEILAHIDEETRGFDQIIAKIREAIDRLKELRTALISAAVTGRIDVREKV